VLALEQHKGPWMDEVRAIGTFVLHGFDFLFTKTCMS
jgi:hypothetical protein